MEKGIKKKSILVFVLSSAGFISVHFPRVCVCSFQLLYQETNLGVAYEYSVPEGITQAEAETYDWIYGTFGECSEECGGGEWPPWCPQ